MPRPRPPKLEPRRQPDGSIRWYYRANRQTKRIHLSRGPDGSPEFWAEYHAAARGDHPHPELRGARQGTLKWAVDLYRASSAWSPGLSLATRRARTLILQKVLDTAGAEPLREISKQHIIRGRERRRETPAAARHFIETLRHFYKWAVEADLVATDPTAGVATPKKSGTGFAAWSVEDCARFEARWPLGTPERVAYAVLRYTGLRRGDAASVGRPHLRDGVIRLAVEKSGRRLMVAIAVHPELRRALDTGPTGDLTFVATSEGRPRGKEGFGNWFRDAARAAGIRKPMHGLRKLAATLDAQDGWSTNELMAKYGWADFKMPTHYTRTADRERLSIEAARRTESRTSIPPKITENPPNQILSQNIYKNQCVKNTA